MSSGTDPLVSSSLYPATTGTSTSAGGPPPLPSRGTLQRPPTSSVSADSYVPSSRFSSTPNPLSHSVSSSSLTLPGSQYQIVLPQAPAYGPSTPSALSTTALPSADPMQLPYSFGNSYSLHYPTIPGAPPFMPSSSSSPMDSISGLPGSTDLYGFETADRDAPSFYDVTVLHTSQFPTLSELFKREIFCPDGRVALDTRINKMSVESREALSQLLNAFIVQMTVSQSSSTSTVEASSTAPSEAALAVLLSFDDLTDTSLLKGMAVGLRRIKGQQVTVSSLLERIYTLKERINPSTSSILSMDSDDEIDAGHFTEGTDDRPLYADQEVALMLHSDKGRFSRKLGLPTDAQGLAPLYNDLKQLKTLLTLTKSGVGSQQALAELYQRANSVRAKICANSDLSPDQKLALGRFVGDQLNFIKNRYMSTGMPASLFVTEMRKMLVVLSAEGADKKLSSSDAAKLEKKITELEKLGDKVIKLGSEWDGFINAYVDAKMAAFLAPVEKEYQFCVGQLALIKVAEQSYTKNRDAQIALGFKKENQSALEVLNGHIERQRAVVRDVEFGVQLLDAAGQLLSENSSKMMSLQSIPELQSQMMAIQFALSMHVKEVNDALSATTGFLVDLVNPIKQITNVPPMFGAVVSRYNLSDEAHRVACFKECYSTLVDGFTYEVMGQYKVYMEDTQRSYQGLLAQKKLLEEQLKGGKLPQQSPASTPSMPSSGLHSSPPPFAPSYYTPPFSTAYLPSAPPSMSTPPSPTPVVAFTPVTPPDHSVIEREQQARVAINTVISSLEGFLQTRYDDPNFAELSTRYYQQVGVHKGTKNADKVYAKYAEILTTHLNWYQDGTDDWAERMFHSTAAAIPGTGDVGRMVYLRLVAMKWAMGQAASL